MTSLEQLADVIGGATENGLAPTETTMRRWHELAQAALKEAGTAWLTEQKFRMRTGASDKWCLHRFEEYCAAGLARPAKGRGKRPAREWHLHARLPKTARFDVDGLAAQIAEGMEKAS